MKFTVLGSTGFIGSRLVRHLGTQFGCEVYTPGRSDLPWLHNHDLGHVFYCIGMTSGFRGRPFETVDANLSRLLAILENRNFESFLYLSSTRVYGVNEPAQTVNETSSISLVPNADTIYDLSKLTAESICLSMQNSAVRVVRLSNVFGRGQSVETFLGSVLHAVTTNRRVTIFESPESAKDYVNIDNVVDAITYIALNGRHRLYNVASGQPVSHRELAQRLTETLECTINFCPNGALRTFPAIDISRLRDELPSACRMQLLDHIPKLLSEARNV